MALLVLVTVACLIFVENQLIEKQSIGKEAALNFACRDAGLIPAILTSSQVRASRDGLRLVYDVTLSDENQSYQYRVDGKDGRILSCVAPGESGTEPDESGQERTNAEPDKDGQERTDAEADKDGRERTIAEPDKDGQERTVAEADEDGGDIYRQGSEEPGEISMQKQIQPAYLTVDQAKAAVLSDCGQVPEDIQFTECRLTREVEETCYSLAFYSKEMSYAYLINAGTGEILTVNSFPVQPETEKAGSELPENGQAVLEAAKPEQSECNPDENHGHKSQSRHQHRHHQD